MSLTSIHTFWREVRMRLHASPKLRLIIIIGSRYQLIDSWTSPQEQTKTQSFIDGLVQRLRKLPESDMCYLIRDRELSFVLGLSLKMDKDIKDTHKTLKEDRLIDWVEKIGSYVDEVVWDATQPETDGGAGHSRIIE